MNDKSQSCKVLGIGTIRLKIFDDQEFILHSMRYVPELR